MQTGPVEFVAARIPAGSRHPQRDDRVITTRVLIPPLGADHWMRARGARPTERRKSALVQVSTGHGGGLRRRVLNAGRQARG